MLNRKVLFEKTCVPCLLWFKKFTTENSRVERKDKHNYLSFQPPHQTVRAVFPHTAFL